jgi:hypothetical protein
MVELLEPLPGWTKVALGIISTIGPLFTLAAAVIAGVIAWRALKQKEQADRHAEWWKRTQWAVEKVCAGDVTEATVAMDVLMNIEDAGLTTDQDLELLHSITDVILERIQEDQFQEDVTELPSEDQRRGGPLSWLASIAVRGRDAS